MSAPTIQWPTKMVSKDGKLTGTVVSTTRLCRMEGCNGIRIGVRWPDGKLTYPCSKGTVTVSESTWRIG